MTATATVGGQVDSLVRQGVRRLRAQGRLRSLYHNFLCNLMQDSSKMRLAREFLEVLCMISCGYYQEGSYWSAWAFRLIRFTRSRYVELGKGLVKISAS